MKKIVLASNNKKKVAELTSLLGPLGIEIVTQGELGISEAEEPFFTFVENALAKARHVSRESGLPALADDSGLCVDVLGGAPGVLSARYAQTATGETKSDERNNEALLKELAHLSRPEQRSAHFVCVLVLVRHADDPQPIICEGEWQGQILQAAQGEGGFGYDPLFWDATSEASAAEMPADIKNARSHRGKAIAQLAVRLRQL
jgi:XTP/dITP diphosphohydrolase